MDEVLKGVNWKKHRTGLVVLSLSIVFFVYGYYVYSGIVQTHQQTEIKLKQQKQTNSNARVQMEIFDEYYPLYNKLRGQGIVGNNNRLQWIESLKQVGERYLIPSIDFTLQNAEKVSPVKEHYYHEELDMETTNMVLRMKLLHDGDWYNLMRYLHTQARGVFSAEECEVTRDSPNSDASEGLVANCILKWYTLQDMSERWTDVSDGEE